MKRLTFSLVAFLIASAKFALAAEGDVTLLGSTSLSGTVHVSDIWGYVDQSTMREYAIIGDWDARKVYIIDATDPANMSVTAEISSISAFDVKVWDTFIYTCDGTSSGLDSWIIDISTPSSPVVTTNTFPSAHNIAISSTGTMYLQNNAGLRTMDISADPLSPVQLAWDDRRDYNNGRSDGHDATARDNRLYDFAGALGTFIWDVTDPANPVMLGAIRDPGIIYNHSGDVTADHQTLVINDELSTGSNPDITLWDISMPDAPAKVGSIGDSDATVHNAYIIGDLLYVAYYSAGFKVFDISNPSSPLLRDEFDTSSRTGDGYVGAFGVYPYAPNNRVYVSDIDNGLFVFSVENNGTARVASQDATDVAPFSLQQNFPNPFNPETQIAYELFSSGAVTLDIYNVAGQRVRRLVHGTQSVGTHSAHWDGRDDVGHAVTSGVYFYRLTHATRQETRRMVLVK